MQPVFIVGGNRRERDFLRTIIEPHSDLSFAPESDTLARLVSSVADNWPTLAYEGFPEQRWYKAAGESYATLRTARAEAEGKAGWVESLDATTLSLRVIDRIYPRCHVVHLVTGNPFDLRAWSVRKAARTLSAGRYSEVSLRDLHSYPTVVRRAVLDRLVPSVRQAAAA